MRHNYSWKHWSTPERITGTKDTPKELVFFLAKLPIGQRTALASKTDSKHVVQSETNRIQGKVTAEPCQDRAGQSFKFPCFWKWSVRYSRPIAKVGCPNIAERLWVTVQAAKCLSFLASLGSCLLALPTYSGNIIFLFRPLIGLKTR